MSSHIEIARAPSRLSLARKGVVATLLLFAASPSSASTLSRVRQSRTLRCGINQETPEYSTSDDHGARQAFDADICKAVAIAILGPNARTTITNYPDDVTSMRALRAGKVDLIPTLTLDLKHSATAALTFSPPLLYDGIGFLVPIAAKLTQASELSGKKICFLAETEVELALRAWFEKQNLKFLPFPFQEEGEMEAAYVTGNCTALAGDLTRLASIRLAFGPLAARYTLLPGQISQDPLAAATRTDDPVFANIVRWVIEALLNAEAAGVTRESIGSTSSRAAGVPSRTLSDQGESKGERSASSSDPTLQILTGQTHEIGPSLGLDNAWAIHVIAAVGNYGEIYDRDLGDQSPLKLPRSLNRLDTQGGLQVPLPLK